MRDLAKWQASAQDGTKAIFEGLVERQQLPSGTAGPPSNAMSMTPSGSYRTVTVLATRVYRGPKQDRYTVITGWGGGDCGFDFETGKRYLIFTDEHFFTSICTSTEASERAGPTLRVLRGEPPAPEDLLAIDAYYERMRPKWYGKICGRVTKPDGKPLSGASVELRPLRDDPFPPKRAGDRNLSKPDGSYCIPNIEPGKYLLTAETTNFKAWTRLMGFYPGVATNSEAIPVEVKAGENKDGLEFAARLQRLYSVQVQVLTSDGNMFPSGHLGVSLDSPDRDALAYHLNQNRQEDDGFYWFGYVSPGHYVVTTHFRLDLPFESQKAAEEVLVWSPAKQEIEVSGSTKIVLKLVRKK